MSPIKTHRPEIQVLIDGKDVTGFLGDAGGVTTQKSLYAPHGEFHITFPDMPFSGFSDDDQARRDSLYGHARLMSPVIISARRGGPWVPVMRGFVRSATRDEQVMPDGRPMRSVAIVGHDAGAAFIMQQIHTFISWMNLGVYPQGLAWLRTYSLDPRPYPVSDFIWHLAQESTLSILREAGFAFQRNTTVREGIVLPYSAQSSDGPVWAVLQRYSDSPWNELFVREGVDNPELVFRPTPWVDLAGRLIDPAARLEPPRRIAASDIVQLTAHRDDAELVNHVWVQSPVAVASALAQPLVTGRGMPNAETREVFGDRIDARMTTNLLPQEDPLSTPADQMPQVSLDTAEWIIKRVEWATRAGQDIHHFERGRMTIKGNPVIRVGDYIEVQRGEMFWYAYVTTVGQSFAPYKRWVTTLDYIRGTQFVMREQVTSPWESERNHT